MQPRSYYRSHNLESPNDIEGYEKVIKDLESRIDARSTTPTDEFPLFKSNREQLNRHQYAEILRRQMQERSKQKEVEKVQRNRPAISEDFHGYPNLPQTPRKIRRQRELDQMKIFRESLNSQLLNKNGKIVDSKSRVLDLEKKMNEDNFIKMNEEKMKKQQKKAKQQEILVNSWNLAVKAKELQKELETIERLGVSHRRHGSSDEETPNFHANPEDPSAKAKSDNGFQLKSSMPNGLSKKSSREFLFNQPRNFRSSFDTKSVDNYQLKIQKIIEQARQIRELQHN